MTRAKDNHTRGEFVSAVSPCSATISPPERERVEVVGVPVHVLTYETAVAQICLWAATCESRYVCASNVHMLMEAWDDRSLRDVLRRADLVTADGMPIVWSQRLLGCRQAARVYGPELTLRLCERAASAQVPIGLFGSTEATLELFSERLRTRFPNLKITFALSPPFRKLTAEEDEEVTERIRASGARLLLVGLGCPKQEMWMASHRHRIPAVMLGVGAAFDFIAGTKPQAPQYMQRAGLEWLFRLATEPRRLWRRYLHNNPRFVVLMTCQLVSSWIGRSSKDHLDQEKANGD